VPNVHVPLVYYARRDDLIKIGTTTQIRRRLSAQDITELLAVEPGHFELEDERHTQFAEHRLSRRRGTGCGRGAGPSDWFRPGADLMAHIEVLRALHPVPAIRSLVPKQRLVLSGQEYNNVHKRMARHRGKASLQQCVECGGVAAHWARLNDTDGLDIWNDYVPMCIKCHRAYDLAGRPKSDEHREMLVQYALNRPAEHLRKIREALAGRPGTSPGMTGKSHSEKTRQQISAALRGKRQSPETIEKRRQTKLRRKNAQQQSDTLS